MIQETHRICFWKADHAFLNEVWKALKSDEKSDKNCDIPTVKKLISREEGCFKLSRWVCQHASEWADEADFKSQVKTFLEENAKEDDDAKAKAKAKYERLEAKIANLSWWKDVKAEGFPSSSNVYHFHPVAFLEQMKRVEKYKDIDLSDPEKWMSQFDNPVNPSKACYRTCLIILERYGVECMGLGRQLAEKYKNETNKWSGVIQTVIQLSDGTLEGTGRYVILSWNNNQRRIRLLHMHSISVLNNANVLPGAILGIAGRTGNFSPISARNPQNNYEPNSQYPDHCHMDDGYEQTGTGILSNRNEVDEFNRICLPNYSYPLLFPCACLVSQEDSNPETCNFNDNRFVSTCWAVEELKCPHMNGVTATNRRIQAQLRFLNYYNGSIDGVFGAITTSLNTASGTRRAIYHFKQQRNLLTEIFQDNLLLSPEDILILNQEAPVLEL